jgi:hypothetical protein
MHRLWRNLDAPTGQWRQIAVRLLAVSGEVQPLDAGGMTMLKATDATVSWDGPKKHWQIRIRVGAEIINRHAAKTPQDADAETLRTLAIATAKDEGYALDPAKVSILHQPAA